MRMLGVHEAATMFLYRATAEGQTVDGADRNVLRATRLMRLFNDQLAAMAKLKGRTSQQKVTWSTCTSTRGAGESWVRSAPPPPAPAVSMTRDAPDTNTP